MTNGRKSGHKPPAPKRPALRIVMLDGSVATRETIAAADAALLAIQRDHEIDLSTLTRTLAGDRAIRDAVRRASRQRRWQAWRALRPTIDRLERLAQATTDADAAVAIRDGVRALRMAAPTLPDEGPAPTRTRLAGVVIGQVFTAIETALTARARVHRRRGMSVEDTLPSSIAVARATGAFVRAWFPDLCRDVTDEQIRKRVEYRPSPEKA